MCPKGLNPLYWYSFSSSEPLENLLSPHIDTLLPQSMIPLQFCPTKVTNWNYFTQSPIPTQALVLLIQIVPSDNQSTKADHLSFLIVPFQELQGKAIPPIHNEWSITSPYLHHDLYTTVSILVQKASEQLRNQFIAYISISSQPEHITIQSSLGLEGQTPLEWIVPLGPLKISSLTPHYLSYHDSLEISRSGTHLYQIQLKRKQFYHSPWIIPFALSGTSYIISNYFKNHYYQNYHHLNDTDRQNNPEVFNQTFRKAKNAEAISLVFLGLSALSLGMSFSIYF